MRQLDLDPEVKQELITYLDREITDFRASNGDFQDRIIAEQKDFWAEPSDGNDELPVIGFATLIVPLTAIATEAIHARDMGQMFGLKELVTVDVFDKAQNVKQDVEKLFNNEFLNTMQYRKKIESPLLQITKHGTGVMSVGYRETTRYAVVKQPDESEIKVPIRLESGACFDGIPVEDFMMPFYCVDVDQSPWVGHEIRVSEHTLRQMVANGELHEDAYMNMCSYFRGRLESADVLENQRELTDTKVVFPSEITLQRILLDWEIDDDAKMMGIEVYYHYDSRQLLSCVYNEERDYEKGVYMPLEYRWYGYGIAKMNNSFQAEVTTQHRQRLDNATIANMAMFKVRRTATWIKDDEPIFPGKKWFVEDMGDIEPMFIGDVKASAYNNENQVVIYSQQRTGVNELTLGMPNVGTPGTASDSLARVQESNRKSDYTYNNKKDFANRVLYKAAQAIIKHGVSDKSIYEALPKGAEVEAFLKNKDILKNKLFFNVQLAGAKNNKVLDRNTYTQLTGMTTQYWTQIMALIQQLQSPDPILKMVTESAIKSATNLYLEVLRAYDIPNPENHILDYEAIKSTIPPVAPPAISGQVAPSPASPTSGGITSVVAPNATIDATGGAPQFQLSGASMGM